MSNLMNMRLDFNVYNIIFYVFMSNLMNMRLDFNVYNIIFYVYVFLFNNTPIIYTNLIDNRFYNSINKFV